MVNPILGIRPRPNMSDPTMNRCNPRPWDVKLGISTISRETGFFGFASKLRISKTSRYRRFFVAGAVPSIVAALSPTRWCPRSLAKLVNISPISRVD